MASEVTKGEEKKESPLTIETENIDNSHDLSSSPVEAEKDVSAALVISDRPSEYTRRKPIVVLVGPDEDKHFIHPGLAAAKSPFFRTKLKDCWQGDDGVTKLPEISSRGFGIVVDWMYSGRLPSGVITFSVGEAKSIVDGTPHAFKAADVLMIVKLQNELISNAANIFLEHDLRCTFHGLRGAYDKDLHHTKYYQFLLKSVVKNVMVSRHETSDKWEEAIKSVENTPKVLVDLLRSTRTWIHEPWTDFPGGDLGEFLTSDPGEGSDTPT